MPLRQVGLQPQHLLFLLGQAGLGPGDLLVQPLELDLFLGDSVHVLADLRHEVLDHGPRPLDLELDGHAVLDAFGDAAGERAKVALGAGAEKHQCGQNHTTQNNCLLDHNRPSDRVK